MRAVLFEGTPEEFARVEAVFRAGGDPALLTRSIVRPQSRPNRCRWTVEPASSNRTELHRSAHLKLCRPLTDAGAIARRCAMSVVAASWNQPVLTGEITGARVGGWVSLPGPVPGIGGLRTTDHLSHSLDILQLRCFEKLLERSQVFFTAKRIVLVTNSSVTVPPPVLVEVQTWQ